MSRNLLSEISSLKVYSDQGVFATLDTVTIDLYPNGSATIEPLTSNACVELGTTGNFYFDLSNVITTPTVLTEWYWVMADTTTKKQSGLFRAGGWVESVNPLGPADTCKITANLSESDGIGAIDINTLMTDNNGNTMEIADTYFASTRYFRVGDKIKPSYDFLNSQAYWILPQGASINIDLQTFKISEKAQTVPSQSEITLNSWLNP